MADRPLHAFDTSVIVAAVLGWHEHHAPALHALNDAFSRGRVALPGPALLESYSVMTRLPAPHRVSADDALAILDETFGDDVAVVTLTPGELWRFVRSLPAAQIVGGRSYDAQILACADKARAAALWTLNQSDFAALDHPSIEIREPGA